MHRWTAWKSGIALALLGAAGGAVYAHHIATRSIPVALRAVDSLPPFPTKFQICAQVLDPGDCGYPYASSSRGVRSKYKGGTLFEEFERGDKAGMELAREVAAHPEHEIKFLQSAGALPNPSPFAPILSGTLAGFVLGFVGFRVSCAFRSS